ncbi:MAG: GntR family transcriptional regulator/MocR family aminotransferase [Gammaproteobacteria bacterium]
MKRLSFESFEPDYATQQPVFVQLYEHIRQAIIQQKLTADVRLPASRTLARLLGLSRTTVVSAYDQLVAEGYLYSRTGSGFFVQPGATDDLYQKVQVPIKAANNRPEKSPEKQRLSHPGYPDDRLFPYQAWARCVSRTARLDPQALIKTDNMFGDTRLQRAISDYLLEWRGLEIDPEQVLITAGSIDALENCIRSLTIPGDIAALENPGYLPLRHIVSNQGLSIAWLAIGNQGAELPKSDKSGQTEKLVVLTPSHQFPLGGAMTHGRRQEFLQWANHHNAWIIEDDYDSEMRFSGRPIPAMASLDRFDRTIYVGTFSKVFSVGLRLGYLIMPKQIINRFKNTISRFGIKAAVPAQRALAHFMEDGDLYRHIRKSRRIYSERRKLLIELLHSKLHEFIEFDDHQAGMQLTIKFRTVVNDLEVSEIAKRQGVDVSPLSAQYHGKPAQSGLIMGFCGFNETEIKVTMKKLVNIIQTKMLTN